jgi:hypothetical protein
MPYDPLLQYYKIEHGHPIKKRTGAKILRAFKLISMYLIMTGSIFASFMGVLNFSAYSAIITNWVNPNHLMTLQDNMEQALMNSSIEIHAAELSDQRSLETITEQVALTDPDIIYSRSYKSDRLLSGIQESSSANFIVAPYENRIIIPKLGKNIPLLDVNHDTKAKYGELQNIFMEELKK